MRKRSLAVLAALAVVSPFVLAEERPAVPQLVVAARYVLVTTFHGDEASLSVPFEDRQALARVQDALQKWGRYTLVYRPENADLILVVRKGRLGALTTGVTVGRPEERGTRKPGVGIGIESGNPHDFLGVYDAKAGGFTLNPATGAVNGLDSSPLWWQTQKDGLNPPLLPLFKKFQNEVEKAAAKKP